MDRLALDAAPWGIDVSTVRDWLLDIPGITGAHDLHIWPLSATDIGLMGARQERRWGSVDGLHQRFGIGHSAVQVERAHRGPHDQVRATRQG